MPHIPPLQNSDNQQVKDAFSEITEAFGMVPNVLATYAQYPPLLEANWLKMKRIMAEGRLERSLKEAIALVVSADNGCDYCVSHHGGALKSLGFSDSDIQMLRERPEDAELKGADKALLLLAQEANRNPHNDAQPFFTGARDAGAGTEDILEALAVMEIFAALNRFIDFVGVELEG